LKKATCYYCGKKGHCSNKCPEKDKCSKDEWAVKKAIMHAQAESEKESDEKMTTITQSKLRRGQTRVTNRENGIISLSRKRAYTTTVSSGHLTPKKTASYWTTDQC
jgi:hypothetical protein